MSKFWKEQLNIAEHNMLLCAEGAFTAVSAELNDRCWSLYAEWDKIVDKIKNHCFDIFNEYNRVEYIDIVDDLRMKTTNALLLVSFEEEE